MGDFLLNMGIHRDGLGCLFLGGRRDIKIRILAGAFVCSKVKFVKELSYGGCDSPVTSFTNLSLCGGVDMDLKVSDTGL